MTAQKIIEIAESYLGVHGEPVGSHNVIFNTEYYGYKVNDKNAYYWCVVFVWYVFKKAGASDLLHNGEKVNRCSAIQSWAKSNGLTVDKSSIRPGDLVLFDWEPNNSPDHIAIAKSTVSNGTFSTIEGNVHDTVKNMTRSLDKVILVVRPRYETGNNTQNCDACPMRKALLELYNRLKEEDT